MVVITLRNSRYPSWESGPGLGWSVASAPPGGRRDSLQEQVSWVGGTRLQEQVSRQLPAESRARLFSKEAVSLTHPSTLRSENAIQSLRFSSSLVRLLVYRRRAPTDGWVFPLVAQNDLSFPDHPHPTGVCRIEPRSSNHGNAFSLPLHPSDPVEVPEYYFLLRLLTR